MLAFPRSTSHGRSPAAAIPTYFTLVILLSFFAAPIWTVPTGATIPWPQFRKSPYNALTTTPIPTPPKRNCTKPPPQDPNIDWKQRNFNTISSIYALTVFPNQVPIVLHGSAGVPPGLFSKQVAGRVDPVGNFKGFDDSIEYFFALAPLPDGNPLRAAITSYKITEFSTQCKGVAASVVHLYCSVIDGPDQGKVLPALKQVAFWKFDDQGAVLRYDAIIPNLNAWVILATGVPVFGPTEAQVASIYGICKYTMERCHGPNQQWDSMEQCVDTLSRKPFGNYDEAWGDNVACRSIHLVLTMTRPDHHCPHVGPTGGGKCINVDYPDDYFNDQDVFGDPVGGTFICKD